MINILLNTIDKFLSTDKPIKFSYNKSLETLNCAIIKHEESQNYGIPEYPCDDNNYRADTIFKLPLRLNVLVFVKEKDIGEFETNIKTSQFSENFFTINSMYGKTYKNLKIESFSRELSKDIIGGSYYNISLKEVILVKALVESYKTSSNKAYGSKVNLGDKNPNKIERSSTAWQGLKNLGL